MPELPEVEGLRRYLEGRLADRRVVRADLVAFWALKTVSPGLDTLVGSQLLGVERRGKHIDVRAEESHLVFHLARAGWLVWRDRVPASLPRTGHQPVALRVALDDGAGFDLTEVGQQRRLAVHVVRRLEDVPTVAMLGPDPFSPGFLPDGLASLLRTAGKAQIKGVLRDQRRMAGVGNAYSDELLHAAGISPFRAADSLSDEEFARLVGAFDEVLGAAIEEAGGMEPSRLKSLKRSRMRVHGRAGQRCPTCGDTIAQVSFADSDLDYCPTCQTGGRRLADRRLSRLLK